MANKNYINGVTPKGKAYYAYLRKPEMYEGKELGYSIQIAFDNQKEADAFKNKILDEFEKAKSDFELKPGKKWSKEPTIGMHTLSDGTVTFKFKCKRTYKTKAGDTVKRTIPVVDAKGHPIKANNLGNGSIVRVSYSMSPYWMSNMVNGMSLYLRGVQVLKYVPYGGNDAASLGFSTDEEGYDSIVDPDYDADVEDKDESLHDGDEVPFDEGDEF